MSMIDEKSVNYLDLAYKIEIDGFNTNSTKSIIHEFHNSPIRLQSIRYNYYLFKQ